MSYQNVFFGYLNPYEFNSRDELDRIEENNYLPPSFVSNSLLTEKEFKIGFHINVYNHDSVEAVFYLTDNKTHYGEDHVEDIGINLDNSVAHIQTHIDRGEDKDLTIKWLKVNEKFRGRGLGGFLITLALLYTSIFDSSVKKVLLDDSSDKYANGIYVKTRKGRLKQSQNIYCKMGFKYIDETGGAEMTANLSEILEKNLSPHALQMWQSNPEPDTRRKTKRRMSGVNRYEPYGMAKSKAKHKKKKHTKHKKKRKKKRKSKKSKMR